MTETTWATPQSFFNKLNAEFNFTLDVCAEAGSAKVSRYFSKVDDGLTRNWTRVTHSG